MTTQDTFAQMLLTDVAAALRRYDDAKSQSHMRDLVRTAFAAVEGNAWMLRQHVIDVANTTYGLKPEEKLALDEIALQVSAQGKVNQQQRFIPLPNAIRLIARIANRLLPDHAIDFSGQEWNTFLQAIEIRNRITHPKSASELILQDEDVTTTLDALFWFLAVSTETMRATNLAARDYLGELEDVLGKLSQGDESTLALYQAVARKLETD